MKKTKGFIAVDILYILMMVLPFVLGIVIKILTKGPSEGISITGAQVYFEIPMPLQNLIIGESQVNSLLVIVAILGLCLYLTHGLDVKASLKRQHIAEWAVEVTEKLTVTNMGERFKGFAPFITGILALSAVSSLITLMGLYPPTSDINVTGGWAILVFILITYYKMKAGPVVYAKSFASPVLMAPLNIISEIATPISMAFRHYGNVLSGSVISILIATGLQGLTKMLLGFFPGFLGQFPFLQIGLPAILSLYFDIFSGCLQAYIFAMLTMLYVAGGFPEEEYNLRKAKKIKINGGN